MRIGMVCLRRQGLLFLSSLTSGSILAFMKQPEEFILAGVEPKAGPPRNWRGFTSPSNRVTVLAAQLRCIRRATESVHSTIVHLLPAARRICCWKLGRFTRHAHSTSIRLAVLAERAHLVCASLPRSRVRRIRCVLGATGFVSFAPRFGSRRCRSAQSGSLCDRVRFVRTISGVRDLLRQSYSPFHMTPNQAFHPIQRRGLVRRSLGVGGCNRCVPCAGSLCLGRRPLARMTELKNL
jgi:hypothetical protein